MKSYLANRFFRSISASALCLALRGLASAEVYTFEGLTPGPLNGQDNWVATANAVIERGTGLNASLVFNNNPPALPQAAAARINNPSYSIPTLDRILTNVVIGYDFHLKDGDGHGSSADLALAEFDHGVTEEGKIGVGYFGELHQLLIKRADGSAYAGNTNRTPLAEHRR